MIMIDHEKKMDFKWLPIWDARDAPAAAAAADAGDCMDTAPHLA